MKTIDEKLLMEELEKLTEDYTKTEEKIKTCEQERANQIANKNALPVSSRYSGILPPIV